MEIRKTRHAAFKLAAHIIFITKYRKKVFTKEHLEYLERVYKETLEGFNGSLVEFDGEEDHVHLLIEFPPEWSISKIVNNLKGKSSRMIRMNYPETVFGSALWSRSYFASSVGGAPIETLKKYIQNQNTPD